MTFTSKRFEVKASPWSGIGEPQLSNLSDKILPDDDERLKWMYTQYGPQATFNPYTHQFYPAFPGGGGMGAGLNYGQHEIDHADGDVYNGFQVPIPRISPIDEGMFGGSSNGCPSGFYQFGKVCVPDVSINPNAVGNELNGQNSNFFGKGPSKGVITAVTPPQFTEKNQEFIVITDMQNIGGEPAKFYTSISIPELNMSGNMSNSTLVTPLQKMKIGHRVIMPATVTSSTLLAAQVQLGRITMGQTGLPSSTTQTIDDVAKVSIPAPGFRGGLPPMGGGIAGTTGGGVGFPPGGFGGGPQFPNPSFGAPMPPTFGGGTYPSGGYGAQITVQPMKPVYVSGDVIYVSGGGFRPGEPVTIQTYDTVNLTGLVQFGQRLSQGGAVAGPGGILAPTPIQILTINPSGKIAVVAIGNISGVRGQVILGGTYFPGGSNYNIPFTPPGSIFGSGSNIASGLF